MSQFNPKDGIWITWERQPRNISMAKMLNIQLHELIVNRSRLIKYPILLIRTVFLLIKRQPKFIFVQNPSIVLSFLAVIIGKIFPVVVIVDAHNSGIYPLEGKSLILNYIAKKIIQYAHAIIVTNKNIANYVRDCGGVAIVFPDPLPHYHFAKRPSINTDVNVFLFICTWADDEPYFEVIDAFSALGDNFHLRITGKFSKRLTKEYVDALPKNITLLGFISEEQYQQELAAADFTIDLTLRSNCLVCGAYESIAMEVPAIVSDTILNREIFDMGFAYAENSSESIKSTAIDCAFRKALLGQDIVVMKKNHLERIEQYRKNLLDVLNGSLEK